MSAAICCQSWFTVMRAPHPTLNTSPTASRGASHASRFALTAFATNVKSRVCSPSPKMSGDSFAIADTMNFGTTAAYCEFGSCLGPKILKYRNATASTANEAANARQYSSPASFVTAYGDNGFGTIPSCFGSSVVFPYADDDAAYTTRLTPASRAAISTLSVPVAFA